MMKHLSITALSCSALLALTSPVKAEGFKVGDVFYCESESGAYVHAPEYELIRWKTFKFKFKVESYQVIKFGSGGYFGNEEFNIEFWPYLDGEGDAHGPLEAFRGARRFNVISKGRFTYSRSTIAEAAMLTGTCDKF